nr:solute carrier family 2, facilitated glucose transporter member 5-like [Anolis sagrei ordinatus]
MDSGWQNLMVPSAESHQSGPGVIESSTRNVFVPASEHRLRQESNLRQLTVPSSERHQSGPGVIKSGTRNIIVPESERRQSVTGSKEGSSRQLTVPSSERRQSGPGVIESSTRNVIVPESERRQSVTGSKEGSSRQLTIPSSVRRQSGPGIIGSSTRNVIVPGSSHPQSIAGTFDSSSRSLTIPSSISKPSEKSVAGSVKRNLAVLPPESWASVLSGKRGSTRGPEHRKSVSPSSRGSDSKERKASSEHHHTRTGSGGRKSIVAKLLFTHRGTLPKPIPRPKTEHRRYELTKPLLMITVITSFGSSVQQGYNLWVITNPSRLIEDFYNSTYHIKNNVGIDKTFLSILYTLTLSIFAIGGVIGSLIFSPIVDKFGRKGALMLNNFLSMGSSVLMGLSATIRAYEYTLFSRMVNGICSGIFACAVPLYLAELAPKNLRAGIMTVSKVFFIAGILICQILSQPELLGNMNDWPILLSIPGGLALFQVLILPFFPESPRYLLIQKRKEESARQALQMLRCHSNVDQEVEELYQEDQAEKAEKLMSGMKIICSRGLRWQVISVVILMSGQQFSGYTAASILYERIYRSMSLNTADIQYIGLVSTVSLLLALIIVMYIIDTVGRRILILLGFGMCSILCVLLTMTLELQHTMPWMAYLSSIFVFIFFIGHIIGPGAVPHVLIAELFLQSTRSTAFSLAGFMSWFISLLSGMVLGQVESQIGSYSFLLFWPLCFGTFFYIFKFIPETKAKTFLDIRRLIAVHVNVARKIQVQSPVSNVKPANTKTPPKKGKKGLQRGKRKKRKKLIPSESNG